MPGKVRWTDDRSSSKPVSFAGVRVITTITMCLALVWIVPCATSCPEVQIGIDKRDSALQAHRWKRALRFYRNQKYGAALKALRKTAKALQREAVRLFQPDSERVTKNKTIRRWLQKHVYTRYPSVLIKSDRFTYPVLVWTAWADVACRAGHFREANRALHGLRFLRPSVEARYLEALVAVRMKQTQRAQKLLNKALPHRFLTPYLQGLIAVQGGNFDLAREKLTMASSTAQTTGQKKGVAAALKQIRSR